MSQSHQVKAELRVCCESSKPQHNDATDIDFCQKLNSKRNESTSIFQFPNLRNS
jgi:hypothetical protein